MALEFKKAESPCVIWRTQLPRVNYWYESHTFSKGISHLKFRLKCTFNYTSECFGLHLINCNEPKSNLNVNLSVYVENNNEHRKSCYFGTVTREGAFVTLSMESLKKDYQISDDEISFVFIFDMLCVRERTVEGTATSQSTPLQSETSQIQSSCLQTFSEDIKKLLGHRDYSDFVLKCGDISFPVNRNILSARSEVFAAKFRNKLKESETGVVDIPNVEPYAMWQFLLYLYSGGVPPLNMTLAFSLYQMSDTYAVPSLKQKCASFLAGNLSEEVICPILQLAEHYKNEELMDIVTSFLTTRAEFLKSETWITFANTHPAIGLKVYMKLQKN